MGFKPFKAIANVAKGAVNAVAAPARAVVNVAKGGNVVAELTRGAVTMQAGLNPITMANTASGGLLANTVGAVPLVGRFGADNIRLGSTIAAGDATDGDLRKYAAGQAVMAAAIVGGNAAIGALGGASGASATASTIATEGVTVGGVQVSGSTLAAAAAAIPEVISSTKSKSPAPAPGNAMRSPAGATASSQNETMVLGAIALGAIYYLAKGK